MADEEQPRVLMFGMGAPVGEAAQGRIDAPPKPPENPEQKMRREALHLAAGATFNQLIDPWCITVFAGMIERYLKDGSTLLPKGDEANDAPRKKRVDRVVN